MFDMKGINKLPGIVIGLLFILTCFAGIHVNAAAAGGGVNVFRLYNPNTGEHLYTTSNSEKTANAYAGWTYEGIGWVAPTKGAGVYRLYNPNAVGGDHYYTKSMFEARDLVSKGWKMDNGGAPIFYSGGSTKAYVAYNPNAQSGAHNYTTNSFEQNSLLSQGWKFGSVAFEALVGGKPAASSMNMAQIKAGNFSSLNGVWHSNNNGKDTIITINNGTANTIEKSDGSMRTYNLKLSYGGEYYGIPTVNLNGTETVQYDFMIRNYDTLTNRVVNSYNTIIYLFPASQQIPNIGHLYGGTVGNLIDQGVVTQGNISSDTSRDRLETTVFPWGVGPAVGLKTPGFYALLQPFGFNEISGALNGIYMK